MTLAFAVCDGRATDAEIEELESILDGDRAAKLLYLACLDLHSDLEYHGRRFGLDRRVQRGAQNETPAEACDPPAMGDGIAGTAAFSVPPLLPPLSPLPSPLSLDRVPLA
jgi:hypothetical protein